MKTILKVLIGSRAHNTHNIDSDYDYRGVFVVPTADILSLNKKIQQTSWIEGKNDDTAYEIYKFLLMSGKCNPNVLEMYGAPVVESTELGLELKELFPYVWNSKDVFNAFRGYAYNQRKKFFNNKENRANKFLAAWLRTLWQGIKLLNTGSIQVNFFGSSFYNDLLEIRSGNYKKAEKLDLLFSLEKDLEKAYNNHSNKETDWKKMNKFLLKVRDLN